MSRFPFPMPDGWFQVAWSDELADGGVLPVRAFGKELVLFRGEGGAPALLDAHCPHLGAHLGHGGVVVGDAVRCPFHAWEFGTDGHCRRVPYATRVPSKASVRSWPVREVNRMIFAHHHAHGAAPTWEIPAIAEAERDDWTAFETYGWEVRTHNQEIGENAVDRAHFRYVHGTAEIPDSELVTEGHVRRATQHVQYATPRGPVEGRIEVTAHGMGFTVTRFTGLCETLLLISHTPIDAEHVRSRFSFTQPRSVAGSNVARALVREIVRQMNEDIPIWEHKRYLETPVLCDGDGPIGAYRRWAAQFYTDATQTAAAGR